ncbi:MAG: M48 family metallopeptidase [Epulopiscium sp.]|mgnify:CR=1 FL=1|nr:M48 family metallopeptidase [Candidatus Epulonipiscium sp.]
MKKLIISDIEIEITKKNVKNINLSVHPPNGAVRISAPKKMQDETIRLFAISKLSWIRKQQKKFEGQERVAEKVYQSGEDHYFLGMKYFLNIVPIKKNPPTVEIRNKKYIDLYVKENSTKEQKEKIIKEWYRKELKLLIPPLIEKWEKEMNVQVLEFGVKQMKTRWGTCNIGAKRIWINLELAKMPLHCLEYIVVHEMVHFLERGHGPRFITLMDRFLPTWKESKTELNKLYARI